MPASNAPTRRQPCFPPDPAATTSPVPVAAFDPQSGAELIDAIAVGAFLKAVEDVEDGEAAPHFAAAVGQGSLLDGDAIGFGETDRLGDNYHGGFLLFDQSLDAVAEGLWLDGVGVTSDGYDVAGTAAILEEQDHGIVKEVGGIGAR